ncbi:type IVB secretion system protein IcmH/DotU [Marinomonas posidonica]|uniref:Type IV / VI secretion system protein, DotU family n=1 Tax=Marinomonas posidonica (strain CECT 7376 / NCIMB 14433 / IVIA-Po-181) TaxID=491952 RepID=F6CWV6_MARPP|nr:type IVB secretion system protein IcmH/DotU [Marinomonas posidonica]AEF55518.1 type IV / VI secretion system protein, DotU family [Marinomonas posidonica IVIA-Po-181]
MSEEMMDYDENSDKKSGLYDDLLFDDAENINKDKDYWFQIRGHTDNPFIDSATNFFALSLRVKTLSDCPNIDEIYKQTIEEINITEIELTEKGYDHTVLMAYRYILCVFLDEAVMGTNWGGDSIWAQYSMLSRFHNETWGGEKVFEIMTRLEKDPTRYKELLEFLYQCLILGFQGKFKVMKNGKEEREKIINKLHSLLENINDKNVSLSSPTQAVVNKRYKLRRQIPVWLIFMVFSIGWVAIYLFYYFLLNTKSQDVLDQLSQILRL